jgi:quinol monooxygenase YgiN
MKFIVVVRGKLKDADAKAAQAGHDAAVAKLSPIGRSLGSSGHRAYLNPQNPQEFLAVDTWDNPEGMQKFMSDPATAATIGQLFEEMPEVTVWAEAGWSGY